LLATRKIPALSGLKAWGLTLQPFCVWTYFRVIVHQPKKILIPQCCGMNNISLRDKDQDEKHKEIVKIANP